MKLRPSAKWNAIRNCLAELGFTVIAQSNSRGESFFKVEDSDGKVYGEYMHDREVIELLARILVMERYIATPENVR